MANNRMYLVEKTTGDRILLCKYYPSTGWYMYHDQEKYDDWFDKYTDNSLFGPTTFELEYEIHETEEEKQQVLQSLEERRKSKE